MTRSLRYCASETKEPPMKKLKSTLLFGLFIASVFVNSSSTLLAAEEQIVLEDLTPSQLRAEIEKIQTEFYRVFNASVEDKKLAIICYEHLPTGSNIKEDVCEPQFLIDKRASNANDSRLGIDILLTPRSLQRDLAVEYEQLTAAMNKVAEESQYFGELNSILAALREELESR